MTVALIRWEFDLDNSGTWVDLTSRVTGPVTFREGAAIEQLGGPEPDARSSSLSLDLDNEDGYFTIGPGKAYGPGSRIRLSWRKLATDTWTTRYIGRLAESNIRFGGSSFIQARWLGILWLLKSGRIRGRNVIAETPVEILDGICDQNGIPDTARNFDADADTYGFILRDGYDGVRQLLSASQGRIWDDDQGRIRYESKATRDARTIAAHYAEIPTTAQEVEIPPPRSLTKPFGVINSLDMEVHVFNRSGVGGGDFPISVDGINWGTSPVNLPHAVSVPIGFTPTEDATISTFSLTFRYGAATVTFTPSNMGNMEVTDAPSQRTIIVNNFSLEIVNDTVVINFIGVISSHGRIVYAAPASIGGSITVNDLTPFAADVQVHDFSYEDLQSIALYGVRPRPTALVVAEESATPPGMNYMVTTPTEAIARLEFDRYSLPIPVVAMELNSEDDTTLDHILARRLGDRICMILHGRSQLGLEADFFVRAMATMIFPDGRLRQTLFCVESRLREEPRAPFGLMATEITDTSVTFIWGNPLDPSITSYQIFRGATADTLVEIEDDTGTSARTYTDTGLSADTQYVYEIHAINDYGTSEASDPLVVTTAAMPPPPVTWLFTRTMHSTVVNLDTEWYVFYSLAEVFTDVQIGGGDYRASLSIRTEYTIELDGTETDLGAATAVDYIQNATRNLTRVRFAGDPLSIAPFSNLSSSITMMRIRET